MRKFMFIIENHRILLLLLVISLLDQQSIKAAKRENEEDQLIREKRRNKQRNESSFKLGMNLIVIPPSNLSPFKALSSEAKQKDDNRFPFLDEQVTIKYKQNLEALITASDITVDVRKLFLAFKPVRSSQYSLNVLLTGMKVILLRNKIEPEETKMERRLFWPFLFLQ